MYNAFANKFIGVESIENNATIVADSSKSNINSMWKIYMKPDGKYGLYLLNYDENKFALMSNNSSAITLKEFNDTRLRDEFVWNITIDEDFSEIYPEIHYIISNSEDEYLAVFGKQVVLDSNSQYRHWILQKVPESDYYQRLYIAYDNGFMERYNGLNTNLYNKISYNDILQKTELALRQEFLSEFRLGFLIYSYDKYNSPADCCDKNSIDDFCPGHPNINGYCSNMKTEIPEYYNLKYFKDGSLNCSSGDVITWEFRPSGNTTPAILFCGHRVFNDDGTSDNRAYRNSSNAAVMMYSLHTTIDDFSNTLIHEMGHTFGAPDHYHGVYGSGDNWSCWAGEKCSVCGVAKYRRSETCVMNGVYTDDYEWCEDCKFDIFYNLNNRFLSK